MLDSSAAVEDLHQLRIASRRLEAAIYLCQELVDSSIRNRLLKRIRTLRTASNPVRDLDVMIEWVEKNDLVAKRGEKLRVKRGRKGKSLGTPPCQIYEQKFDELSKSLVGANEFHSIQCMTIRLVASVGQFCDRGASCLHDFGEMHRWHVAVKKLRYQLEFACKAVHSKVETESVDRLIELQQHLGKVCDAKNRQNEFSDFNHVELNRHPTFDADWYRNQIEQVMFDVINWWRISLCKLHWIKLTLAAPAMQVGILRLKLFSQFIH